MRPSSISSCSITTSTCSGIERPVKTTSRRIGGCRLRAVRDRRDVLARGDRNADPAQHDPDVDAESRTRRSSCSTSATRASCSSWTPTTNGVACCIGVTTATTGSSNPTRKVDDADEGHLRVLRLARFARGANLLVINGANVRASHLHAPADRRRPAVDLRVRGRPHLPDADRPLGAAARAAAPRPERLQHPARPGPAVGPEVTRGSVRSAEALADSGGR